MVTFRIDDIGASTKHYNQHGRKWLKFRGKRVFYLPWANFWFFKRISPFRGWAKYEEITKNQWIEFLKVFKDNGIVPIIAVTACWVEKDGSMTSFPVKFPEQAELLKSAYLNGEIIIANHGLTHCIVGKHLPKFWGSNRSYHREFRPEMPFKWHKDHIEQSQAILESFFEKPIEILVPPGNLWSVKTYEALLGTNIKKIICNSYMCDSLDKMKGIEFIKDDKEFFNFHDRELVLYGIKWLQDRIKEHA